MSPGPSIEAQLPCEFIGGRLRRLHPRDLVAFQSYRSIPELGRHQGWSPMSDEEAHGFLDEMHRAPLFTPGQWVQLGIARPDDSDELIGDIGLYLSEDGAVGEVGFTLEPNSQGRGVATLAVREAIRLLFSATPVARVLGITDERNRSSIRLLERIGFGFVESRQAVSRGEPCTERVYALPRNPAIEFDTPRLRLRQWRESDRGPFAALNADPAVMEFFPSPLSRAASDASIDAWQAQFAAQGFSNWAVELKASGQFIGFVGLSVPRRVLPFSPCVEIGWRLARAHWGRGYACEGARGALRIGFERLALAAIVSFTALGNLRSRAVMERIGMSNAGQDFEHPGVPEGHALRLHCLYRITRAQWDDAVRRSPQ